MELLITDHVKINGVDASTKTSAELIEIIRQAEDQIKSYQEIDIPCKAVDKKIASLKKSLKRLVKLANRK